MTSAVVMSVCCFVAQRGLVLLFCFFIRLFARALTRRGKRQKARSQPSGGQKTGITKGALFRVKLSEQGPSPVRKAKSAEIEKFERKIASARAGARHVSWESPQLHARLGPKSPRPNPREFLRASMFMNVVANGNASS